MESIPLTLTYDDVLLVPRFSSIRSRRDINCVTRFTRQIELAVPFISANMDTVTEAPMAIAMAEFGGIGVIHRFQPMHEQARQVARVKRYQSRTIEEPHTISPDASVGEARRLMEEMEIHGLPVVKDDNMLVGILTYRDIQLVPDEVVVSERMTPWQHLVVAPADISPQQAQRTLLERRLEKLPLVDTQGRLVGLITARDLFQDVGLNRVTRDDKGCLRVAAAVGVVDDFLDRAQVLEKAGADALVIDIAHGDSALMLSAIRDLRGRIGDVPLIAGNVATGEGTERLLDAGVDAVKVGVGPGSMCITRQVAGVGIPQLTAVLQCAEVANRHGVPIIADGGVRYSGDVAKAIGAGASSVMLGNMLAGTDESPGVVITRDGQRMKVARGMASTEAAVDRAFRSDPTRGWATWERAESDVAPEGIQAPVPYRGSVREVLQQLFAGLRSGMSYCDASGIEGMWQNARFVRQTEAGYREAGPGLTGWG